MQHGRTEVAVTRLSEATTLLAKCASRYEAAPGKPGYAPGQGYPSGAKHPEGIDKATPAEKAKILGS